ncbi:MAG: ribonuclease HII [Chlorobiaceae bacterium]|nr:ribonuclease HII [Chlorobiaceae bacterium]NTW10659.1 ribonuclease HII [Chlorobiaceae bacterium]
MDTGYENKLWQSTPLLCGIDEAGRGPLAGPVVAAAVIFPQWFRPADHPGAIIGSLDDSKKLSPEERDALAPAIKSHALAWAIAEVGEGSIDEINILQATMLAMNKAVESLSVLPGYLLIDGNRFMPHLPIPYETVVKGDAKVFSIAAASVLAKTHRDGLMKTYGAAWPAYGFDRNFGYPTGEHIAAIREHGRCPLHRRSFRLKALGEK